MTVKGLADLLGLRPPHPLAIIHGKHVPKESTFTRIEAILGPAPDDVRRAIADARPRGLPKATARYWDRVRHWDRQRLVAELAEKHFSEGVPRELERMIRRLPLSGPVKAAGINVMRAAFLQKARRQIDYRSRRTGGVPRSPRTALRRALYWLRRAMQDGAVVVFVCQDCGGVVRKPPSHRPSGPLCPLCWDRYKSTSAYTTWLFYTDHSQPQPRLPRRPGPIPSAETLLQRLIAFLEWVIGPTSGGVALLREDYDRIYAVYALLERSRDAWARKIVAACHQLGKPSHIPS
jgi:hypothetical protein